MGVQREPPKQSNTNGVSTVIIDTSEENPGGAIDGTAETLTQANEWVYPHPTDFKLSNHAIDETKSLKVAVIGAGITGITAGIFLPIKVPGIQLTIFEKNADVSGVWFENIYPGVRCDIPANVYQSTFDSKRDWSEEYAQGPEIREYWQSLAKKHNVYSHVRLNTLVKGVYWNAEDTQWRLELDRKDEKSTEHFDFVILATGIFNKWKMPDIPGINDFKGHLRHSSNWDANFDPTGKSTATIGNGASGIQLTAAIQKIAGHVDHYARSKTWIAGSWNPNTKERKDTPMEFTQEEKESFKDPESYLKFRKEIEQKFYRDLDSYLLNTEKSKKARQTFTEAMKVRTTNAPELLEKLVPDFPPQCRRLTPGPGYLEALTQDNLSFIQTPIKRFTATGIETEDGVHREVDAIICSTGANVSYAPPFPVVSGEYDLSRDWKQDGKFGWPYTYLGVGTPGFPNLAFVMGPHPGGPSGTVPHAVETQITYVARMLRKMSTQRIKTMTPSEAAAKDFVAYCDAFFPKTNMSRNCSSWANGGIPGARIHGYFPGSASALTTIRREPRWEDFDYTYDRPENRFAFWGEGYTKREYDENHDIVPYLKLEKDIDLRDIHEQWWEL